MLVKSRKADDDIGHLFETFEILSAYKMKLNLLKCAFVVTNGMRLRIKCMWCVMSTAEYYKKKKNKKKKNHINFLCDITIYTCKRNIT